MKYTPTKKKAPLQVAGKRAFKALRAKKKNGKIYVDFDDKIIGSNMTKKQREEKIKKDTKRYRSILMM